MALDRMNDTLDLVQSLWPPVPVLFNGDPGDRLNSEFEAYFSYARRQWHILTPYPDCHSPPTSSHPEIAQVVEDAQNGKARETIVDKLKSNNATEESCERALNLSARLLTMMRFGLTKHQLSPRRCLQWETGPLRDFVLDHFGGTPKLSCEQIRLPKSFDAWSITNIAGIRIAFTDNLTDHLLLTEDDSTLLVFHHVSFLERQRSRTSIFPSGLVDETLRTIALLFPQAQYSRKHRSRGPRRTWLQKLRAKYSGDELTVIDARLALCGTPHAEERQIERFQFWRDRLVILKQTYDDATPKSLRQWWLDRRNGVQWYTFWVAVLVLIIATFLSLVQVIEGALQVYKAFESPK